MLTSVITIAALYVLLGAAIWAIQDRLVFPAGGTLWRSPSSPPLSHAYEDVVLDVMGFTTHGWFIPNDAARGVILFSHGNAGTIADRLESTEIFLQLGYAVLIYDYGGYGQSTGKPSEQRCYADARAMWQFLTREKGFPSERIILFGRSLGGAPSVQLATEVQPHALIVESAFLSAPALAQRMLPIYPARLLLRSVFDNAAKIGSIGCPVLVIHSPGDEIVPFSHGQGLFERAREPKAFLQIRGGHNDGFLVSGSAYVEGLRAFLEEHPPNASE